MTDDTEAFYGSDDDEEVRFRTAVRTILRGFDEGVFVRSTAHDHDSAWAIKLFPFLRALAIVQEAFGLPANTVEEAVAPSEESTP